MTDIDRAEKYIAKAKREAAGTPEHAHLVELATEATIAHLRSQPPPPAPKAEDGEVLRFTGTDHTEDAERLASAFGIVGERFQNEASDALMVSFIAGEEHGRASLAAELGKDLKTRLLAMPRADLAELLESIPALMDLPFVPGHWESNHEAGDGQTVCNLCGWDADESHTLAQCRKNLGDDGGLIAELAEKDRRIAELEGQLEGMRGERDGEQAIAVGWESRCEDAEARLAAWGPVVEAVGMATSPSDQAPLATAVRRFDAIPVDLRPGPK